MAASFCVFFDVRSPVIDNLLLLLSLVFRYIDEVSQGAYRCSLASNPNR